MLKLTQSESNLLYWTKGWYENRNNESFWTQIGLIYKEYYDMEVDNYDGIYHMVRSLYLKILNVLPNKERMLERYEEETLPSKARYYWGAPNAGNYNWHCHDKFGNEEMIKARICVMMSHLGSTEVKYYTMMPIKEIEGLTLKDSAKEKLAQMAVDNAGE